MKTAYVIYLTIALSLSLIFLNDTKLGAEHQPFTVDKSADFKPLEVKGHEMCYVAEVGKGVMVVLMYGTEGNVKGKPVAMELVLTPEAYQASAYKEGFVYHRELKIYSKHFYAHETPHEMHMEHAGHKH